MRALTELFTTDVGLLSVAVLAFMLGMGGYYLYYFIKHVREDSAKHPPQA
jgi:uncharacterized membrane-anchored protein